MTTNEPLIRDVSDTALWTAAYRADESDRADALFHDPLARRLAGERGASIAREAQSAVRWGVVLRTAMLDEVIVRAANEDGFDAVLNLAAGLDTRPYRLGLPRRLTWVEADLPDLLDYKEHVIGDEPVRCALERVPLDLSDRDARRTLFGRVAESSRRVLVVTEGLLSYLAPERVAELADDLHEHRSFERWATDLTGAQVVSRLRSASDRLSDGRSPALFAPAEGTAFFERHGWIEAEFHDLFVEAPRLGRDPLLGKVVRAAMRFMPRERRKAFERGIGVAVLERAAA